jgi:hypothetical protein
MPINKKNGPKRAPRASTHDFSGRFKKCEAVNKHWLIADARHVSCMLKGANPLQPTKSKCMKIKLSTGKTFRRNGVTTFLYQNIIMKHLPQRV